MGVLDEELPILFEPGFLFMQDNAPFHIGRLVREWLEENGIDVLEWPPCSLDLNPIEHLWFRLVYFSIPIKTGSLYCLEIATKHSRN